MAHLVGGGDSVDVNGKCQSASSKQGEKVVEVSSHAQDFTNSKIEESTVDEEDLTARHAVALLVPDGPYKEPFLLSTFPWIALSRFESQLLSDCAQKLSSDDARDAEEACYQLLDVFLYDFPAEVFLQRPAILQGLLGLLDSNATSTSNLAFACVVQLTQSCSVRFYKISSSAGEGYTAHNHAAGDCSMSVPEVQSFSSSSIASIISSRSSLLRNGRRDSTSRLSVSRYLSHQLWLISSVSHVVDHHGKQDIKLADDITVFQLASLAETVELDSPEESLKLQLRQIPLPVFICAVIDVCLNALGEELPYGLSQPLYLLDLAARLQCAVVNPSMWSSNSTEARKMAENLLHSLHATGNRVLFHAKRSERVLHEAKTSRLIYVGLSKIVYIFAELIPVAQFQHIPAPLRACLPWICQDESLALCFPVIRERLLPYLKVCSPTGYEAFKEARDICSAMSSTCIFISDSSDFSSQSYQADAERALDALPSLVYHQSSLFLQRCFQLCSQALTKSSDCSKVITKLLVRLLAYSNPGIQKQVYDELFKFVADILNIRNAADPKRTPGANVVFLLNTQVMREIVLYGLFQPDTRKCSQNILSLLSQKFLINNATVWNRLKTVARSLISGIFMQADLETDFGRRVLSWSQDQEEENALFDEAFRYRAAFVMLYHQNRLVRGHASSLILQRIGEVRLHGDTLIPESQYAFDMDGDAEPFSIDSLKRGLRVWQDSRLDVSVRWTALRQIHSHLRRPAAQESFVRLNGPQSFLGMLTLIVDGTEQNWNAENLALLFECILAVIYNNEKWRMENAQQMSVYENVIIGLSMIPLGSALWNKIQSTASTIVFLLAFDDALMRKEKQLSICCTFYRQVMFPCSMIFHDFNKKTSKAANCDLLRSPVAEMLVTHWNVALAGGVTNVVSDDKTEWLGNYAARLIMDDRSKILLRVCHPHFGFTDALSALENAQGHSEAIQAVDTMSVYLVLFPFLHKEDCDEIPPGVESAFRYVTVLPHNSSDLNLLRTIAQFAQLAVDKEDNTFSLHWIHGLLFDQRSLFVEAVRKANRELSLLANGKASLRVAYIAACKSFASTAWSLFRSVPKILGSSEEQWDVVELLDLFMENLRNVVTLPFLDLGALGMVCRCLAQFCGLASVAKLPETIGFVPLLITTVMFVFSQQHSIAWSFSGRGVVQSASLALMELVTFQVDNQLFPAMLESWKNENGDLSWLLPLWAHRDPVVRSCSLSMATALSQTKEGRSLVIQCFAFVPGGVWNAVLSFLFNAEEPDIVRFNAVNLLAAMLQSDLKKTDLVLRDELNAKQTEGTEALVAMLDQLGFYRAVFQICQSFDGTHAVRPPSEYLLGAVFRLCAALIRLVGKRAVTSLKGLKFFHAAMHVCFLVKSFVQQGPRLPDRLQMFSDLFAMLGHALQTDETVAEIISYNMHTFGAGFTLLDPETAPVDMLRDLWINIYTVLSESLQNSLVLEGVWRFLSDYHKTIYSNIKASLNLNVSDAHNQRLQIALLSSLEVVTAVDREEVHQFLWKPVAASPSGEPESIGEVITHFLVQKFDEPAALEFDAWIELLKRLLLRHEAVRQVAMDSGFVETVIDKLLEMDCSISKDIHIHSKNVLKKKMTEPLRMCLELLMNLLFRNEEAKKLAAQKSLTSVLISLWLTLISDTESLHILFLRLLCTYGARCQESLASFVKESEYAQTAPLTLFHVIIADLEEQLALPLPHPDITPLLFDLLSLMSLNPKCRVFIRKTVNVKRAMPAPSPRKPKYLQAIDAMWLDVLANLSFFEDGQIVILAKEDICAILFDYLEVEGLFKEIYISSMLILRNLAFSRKGMARLTGARGVLAKLIRLCSTHPQPKVRLYALSCLLELLYDQVKLRHAAKSIAFAEFGAEKDDDEPQMFNLRARLRSCLEDIGESNSYNDDNPKS